MPGACGDAGRPRHTLPLCQWSAEVSWGSAASYPEPGSSSLAGEVLLRRTGCAKTLGHVIIIIHEGSQQSQACSPPALWGCTRLLWRMPHSWMQQEQTGWQVEVGMHTASPPVPPGHPSVTKGPDQCLEPPASQQGLGFLDHNLGLGRFWCLPGKP